MSDVHFNNLISQAELEKEYQSSYLYFYPGTTPETFGISVYQAMATGTPVVMNACNGLNETCPPSCGKHAYFGSTQAEEFIAHIMRLYYDDAEWNKLHSQQQKGDCS